MLKHDIKDHLDTSLMCLINKILEFYIFLASPFLAALIAEIYIGEIHSVIAVIVEAGSVLYDWSDPDSSETKRLDVIKLLDKTGEIATPYRVIILDLILLTIPGENVILRIPVIEAGGHREVDCFVTEVCTIVLKTRICKRREWRHRTTSHHCRSNPFTEKSHIIQLS